MLSKQLIRPENVLREKLYYAPCIHQRRAKLICTGSHIANVWDVNAMMVEMQPGMMVIHHVACWCSESTGECSVGEDGSLSSGVDGGD